MLCCIWEWRTYSYNHGFHSKKGRKGICNLQYNVKMSLSLSNDMRVLVYIYLFHHTVCNVKDKIGLSDLLN